MNGVLVDRELLDYATEVLQDALSWNFAHDPEKCRAVLTALRAALALPAQAAADAAGLQRSTTTRQIGALTLTAVPCLKDPETGEVFFTPDVTAVLVSLAGALEVQERRDGVNVAELHRLALEASDTKSTGRKVRHARDELVRICLSLGGETAPVETPADEGTDIPPEIVEIVTLIGPAQWSRTPAQTPEEHGEGMARSVRLTAEHFNQGDEPQHMQMLVREGTDIVIGYTGTSPHSAQITRALAGAWNHLHQLCVQKAGGES